MELLYGALAVIFLALVLQGVAARKRGFGRPSMDRYHTAMTRLGEMSEHVKLLDEQGAPEHQATRSVRDVRPRSASASSLPPTKLPWVDSVTVSFPAEPETAAPLSPAPLIEEIPAVEEADVPALELLEVGAAAISTDAEPVATVAAELSVLNGAGGDGPPADEAADGRAAGVRGAWGRPLARLRSLPPWAGLAAAVVVLGGAGAGVLLTSASSPPRPLPNASRTARHRPPAVTAHVLPNLVGLSAAQAEANATAAGFTWQLVAVPSPGAGAAGHVLAQVPTFPGILAVGGTVTLRVGAPLARVTVPDVANQRVVAAEAALRKAGFVTRTTPVKAVSISQLALQGEVLRQVPAAGRAEAKHSMVTLDVVSGAASVSVPSGIIGEPLGQAGATLAGAQLRVGTTSSAFSTTVPSGLVSSASPGPGPSVAVGTTVNLVVSAGPPAVVPQLRGDTLAEARHALRAAGLVLGRVNHAPGASGIVLAQAARAGRTLTPGTAITLVVGQVAGGSSGVPVTTAAPAGNSGT